MFDVLLLVIILVLMLFIILKRQAMFRGQELGGALGESANGLKHQMEEAADLMVARMQEQAEQLTFLINEADARIAALDEREKRLGKALDEEAIADKNVAEPVIKESKITLQVFDMLAQKYDVEEISRLTGMGKGAVMLIEQMYKKKQKSSI